MRLADVDLGHIGLAFGWLLSMGGAMWRMWTVVGPYKKKLEDVHVQVYGSDRPKVVGLLDRVAASEDDARKLRVELEALASELEAVKARARFENAVKSEARRQALQLSAGETVSAAMQVSHPYQNVPPNVRRRSFRAPPIEREETELESIPPRPRR